MRRSFCRSLLLGLLLVAAPAHAVTIAVGSETFLVETFPIDAAIVETSPLPLDLAIDARTGNTIWMIGEFDRRIYSIARTAADATTMTTYLIDAPASPLFRSSFSDTGTLISSQQERIQTTTDGSVYASQGGNILYGGTKNNWSRIVRRNLDGTWDAFTLPIDGAGAVGFYVTNAGAAARMWVMASGDNALYETRLRGWHEGETSAVRYPPSDSRWVRVRSFDFVGPSGASPAMLIGLTNNQQLAGTLYFGSIFFLYNFRTSVFDFITLPASASVGPLGTKPWQIRQHPDGTLWIVEDAANRVTRYNLSTGTQTQYDFSASMGTNEHAHSIAFDGTDAYVTTYNSAAGSTGVARLVKISNAGTITVGTSFSTISLGGGLTGIERDSTGKLWVCLWKQAKVARLTRQ